MVNDEYKFILILLPKTGTTSLSNIEGIKVKNNVHKHYSKLDDNQLDYLKISTCRNPFSRVVSLWNYWNERARRKNKLLQEEYFPNISFNYFVNHFPEMEMRAQEISGRKLDDIHFKSCTEGVQHSTYNKISYKDIDFWIKMENLQEDFNIVCDKVGIRQQQIPHRNNTSIFSKISDQHHTKYYNNKTRQIVAEKYAKDIEYLDYKFGD